MHTEFTSTWHNFKDVSTFSSFIPELLESCRLQGMQY